MHDALKVATAASGVLAAVLFAGLAVRHHPERVEATADRWDLPRFRRGDCQRGYVTDYFGEGVPYCRPAGFPSCTGCADEPICFGRFMQRGLHLLPYRDSRIDWEHMMWLAEQDDPVCVGRLKWWWDCDMSWQELMSKLEGQMPPFRGAPWWWDPT